MTNRKLLIATFVATALFGCKEGSKSVDYYAKHADETKAKVTECRKDPNAETNQDCRNATKALHEIRQKEKSHVLTEAEWEKEKKEGKNFYRGVCKSCL